MSTRNRPNNVSVEQFSTNICEAKLKQGGALFSRPDSTQLPRFASLSFSYQVNARSMKLSVSSLYSPIYELGRVFDLNVYVKSNKRGMHLQQARFYSCPVTD